MWILAELMGDVDAEQGAQFSHVGNGNSPGPDGGSGRVLAAEVCDGRERWVPPGSFHGRRTFNAEGGAGAGQGVTRCTCRITALGSGVGRGGFR